METDMKKFLFALFGSFLMAQTVPAAVFTPESTVKDVLSAPEFSGFAERLFPWDRRTPPADLPLSRISELMPYHSHVNPDEIAKTLTRMASDGRAGRTVFFDIYSEAEKTADPGKRHTGVFFFRGKAGAPFAMIAPGGGFAYAGSLHEGFPIADSVSREGMNAFVVKYRADGSGRHAAEDMAHAIEFVRKNSQKLNVAADDYSTWGGSAGARMAAVIGSWGTAVFGTETDSKPSAVIMLYTGHSDYNPTGEPPIFVGIGEFDGIASPYVMKSRLDRISRQGTMTEFHLYPALEHGFALGTGTSAEGWEKQAVKFWRKALSEKQH